MFRILAILAAVFLAPLEGGRMSLPGARMFFASRKAAPAAPTARDYVQSGLLAMWDGIENAGWGQHDAAATTWKDLVGARDMVLSNAVFANDAVFRAEYSDGQGFLAYNGGGRFSDNIISFELCANIVFDGWLVPMSVGWSKDYYEGLGIKARALSTYGVFVKGYLGGKTYRIPYPAGNIVGTVSCSDVAYHNGTAMTEDSEVPSPTAPNFDSRGVCVGSNTTYNVKGSIFNVRLYNRLLSPAEVAANYAIDKARFNLT